jgi:hypothetical protein
MKELAVVQYFHEGFGIGLRLGIDRAPKRMDQWTCNKTFPMSDEARDNLLKVMKEEITEGRVLVGLDFGLTPPLKEVMESPVFVIPKNDMGTPIPGKFRQIMHSSWPNPALGLSMNDLLNSSQRTVAYTAFDRMICMFLNIGQGGYLIQVDFEKAYRMLPIHPMDWAFLGMKAGDLHAVDTRLIFGAGEAPAEFTSFGDCIKWSLQANCLVRWLDHYLDDFISGEITKERAELVKEIILTELDIMGVKVNSEKVKVGQVLKILGIEVNMLDMTVSVPSAKVTKLCGLIKEILQENKGLSLKELRSLAGSISTCAMVVRQGRMFTQEINDTVAAAAAAGRGLSEIPSGMRAELPWWLEALQQGKGTQMMLQEARQAPSATPFSDASSEYGMAGIVGEEAWQHMWSLAEKRLVKRADVKKVGQADASLEGNIAIGEMAAVCVTASLFRHQWKGKVIEFRCDNSTVCIAVNTGKCKIKRVREMVKWLAKLAVGERGEGFHIYLRYVPSVCNISDLLSRQAAASIPGQMLRLKSVESVASALKEIPRWPA